MTAVRLRTTVSPVRRSGFLILLDSQSGSSVRISRVGEDLLPLLIAGADRDALCSLLSRRYPGAADIGTKLDAFVSTLEKASLLEGKAGIQQTYKDPRHILFNPDPIIRNAATLLKAIPSSIFLAILGVLLVASICGTLAFVHAAVTARAAFFHLHYAGFLIFALGVMSFHEMAHALACRTAGAPVSGIGVILRGGFFPTPYVSTKHAYAIENKWRRFCLPAAGPVADLLAGGTAAWIALLSVSKTWHDVAATTALLALTFFYFDSNPFKETDGSQMLQILLDDDLLRQAALGRPNTLSNQAAIQSYRTACLIYVLITLAFVSIVVWRCVR